MTMARKAKAKVKVKVKVKVKDPDVTASAADLMSHPATVKMLGRMSHFSKPPIKWLQQADGSWLECYLLPDGTYGNCDAVAASQVPKRYAMHRPHFKSKTCAVMVCVRRTFRLSAS